VPSNFFGFQISRTGNSYFGLEFFGVKIAGVEYREYAGNGLKKQLSLGKTYCVTYYVSLAEYSRYACSNIGVIFSQDSIVDHNPIFPPTPIVSNPSFESTSIILDTINWTKIEGLYYATGTERFITLGNFRPDANTNNVQVKPLMPLSNDNAAYYYIDDVSVVEINSANASAKDTLISRCISDSVMLGTDSTEFATYTWQSSAAGLAALSCTNCPNPIAKPQITTKYYLTKVQCSATTMDSVTVVVLTPNTQANAGTNQLICEGDIIQIGTKDSLAYTSYAWMPTTGLSCTNCATPYANPNATTIYNLTRQECNVITTSNVKIIIDDCNPTYTVPNVFTPNYDGVNDTWGVTFSSSKYIKNFQMQIYNRWGLLIYQTNSGYSTPNIKWDGHTTAGSECTNGVYYYIISFDKNEEKVELKGSLNLFR
jgi:gliding motility-associated-like protein